MDTQNDRYAHLLRKARDARRGGHDAWGVQSTEEKVAVALALNRSDWLAESDYTIPEAIERAGRSVLRSFRRLPASLPRRSDAMHTVPFHRFYRASGIIAALLLALLLIGTPTGRDMLAWIYLQSTEAVTNATHFHRFPLDRLDPTCPQCM
jgi:hypothetical protein